MANPWDFGSGTIWHLRCADYPDFIGTTCIETTGCVDATASIFSGISHLNGETVAILADGKVLAQQVVSGGTITLSSAAAIVRVGLPYYSELETLDMQIPLASGTSQGSKIKVGNLTYRFIESKGGWIGPDEDNLYEAFTDDLVSLSASQLVFSPEDYDWDGMSITDPTPYLYTGDLRRPLGAGYETGGRSYFRQVDPLPVTITAILPELKVGQPSG